MPAATDIALGIGEPIIAQLTAIIIFKFQHVKVEFIASLGYATSCFSIGVFVRKKSAGHGTRDCSKGVIPDNVILGT